MKEEEKKKMSRRRKNRRKRRNGRRNGRRRKRTRRRMKKKKQDLEEGRKVDGVQRVLASVHLVLSEIHSSLMSSLSLGRILMTSPLRVFTTMLLPTASSTSIVSVFLGEERIQISDLHLAGS